MFIILHRPLTDKYTEEATHINPTDIKRFAAVKDVDGNGVEVILTQVICSDVGGGVDAILVRETPHQIALLVGPGRKKKHV